MSGFQTPWEDGDMQCAYIILRLSFSHWPVLSLLLDTSSHLLPSRRMMRGRASWVSSSEGWFLRLLSWPLTPPQCATRSWCCTTPTTRTPGPFQVRAAPWVERPVTWMQRARCPFKLENEGILLPPLYLKPFRLSHIRLILPLSG